MVNMRDYLRKRVHDLHPVFKIHNTIRNCAYNIQLNIYTFPLKCQTPLFDREKYQDAIVIPFWWSLSPSLSSSPALMGLKEVPPLSSPDTTTTGKACHRKPPLLVLLELRNGFERWRLGGATSNRRHYVHHRVRCSITLFFLSLLLKSIKNPSKKSPYGLQLYIYRSIMRLWVRLKREEEGRYVVHSRDENLEKWQATEAAKYIFFISLILEKP